MLFINMLSFNKQRVYIILCVITGQTQENPSKGAVDNIKSHFQPNVGITIKANKTSKQAPSAQKH